MTGYKIYVVLEVKIEDLVKENSAAFKFTAKPQELTFMITNTGNLKRMQRKLVLIIG